MMKTVKTKEEFEQAILNRETKILCVGAAATPFIQKRKRKRAATIGGGLVALAGLVAIPFTAGASAPLVAAGLTIGSVTITAAELFIIFGGVIALTGVIKGAKVVFKKNGEVVVEPQYKN